METITTLYNALCEREEDKATSADVRRVICRFIIPTAAIIVAVHVLASFVG